MNKNNIIITILILLILGGCIFYFHNKKKDDNKTSNSNSTITSNIESNSNYNNDSNIIEENNSNSNIEEPNSNITSNPSSNKKSNITSNSNSNIKSNSNKSNSNNTSNPSKSNSNSTSNTTTTDKALPTNGSFSGIFESDNNKVHMLQIGNKVHFYVTKRDLKNGVTAASMTMYGTVSGNTVSGNYQGVKFVLKEKGIQFSSSNSNIPNGYIPKVGEYNKSDYFTEFMNGNLNGTRGVFQNKYGTVKIYQQYNTSLRAIINVKKKNAIDINTQNTYISGSLLLNWNNNSKIWTEGDYKTDCDSLTDETKRRECSWMSIKINGNILSIESDAGAINTIQFHAGKYFDADKNKLEPTANQYTKVSDYTIDQIVTDAFN